MRLLTCGRVAAVALLLFFATARASAQGYSVGGHAVAVALAAERPTVVVGEPVFLTFELRNLSGRDLQVMEGGDYRNKYGRPDSYRITVTGDEGQTTPELERVMSMGGLAGPRPVPAGGSYKVRLLLQHWLTLDAPGSYTVTCRKTLSMAEKGVPLSRSGDWKQAEVVATARVRLRPRDEAAVGESIERLARELRESLTVGDYDEGYLRGRDAMNGLSVIDDPRVVPHLAAMMKEETARFDYLKFAAVRALAKFDTDAALEAIESNARDRDDNMRGAVAFALSESKHPRALAALLSMRTDKSYAVRLTIVHALGRRPTPDSTALLRDFSTDDPDERLRAEAACYLRERPDQ